MKINEKIIFGDKKSFAIEVIPKYIEDDGGITGNLFIWINNEKLGDKNVVCRISICLSTLEELLIIPSKYKNKSFHSVELDDIKALYRKVFFNIYNEQLPELELIQEELLRKHAISYYLGEWFDNNFIIAIKIETSWRFIWLCKKLTTIDDLSKLKEFNVPEKNVNAAIFRFLFWIFNSGLKLKQYSQVAK